MFIGILGAVRTLNIFRDVSTDLVKTGLGGAAGNKGGVAIRMVIKSITVLLVH